MSASNSPIRVGRLRRRSEFIALRGAARLKERAFILQFVKRDESADRRQAARFGFTVTRKTGNAVERNRIRRRLKEAVRLTAVEFAAAGHDFVLIGRRAALRQDFAAIRQQLEHALSQAGRNSPRRKTAKGSTTDDKSG